jgi:hypothetical protein
LDGDVDDDNRPTSMKPPYSHGFDDNCGGALESAAVWAETTRGAVTNVNTAITMTTKAMPYARGFLLRSP